MAADNEHRLLSKAIRDRDVKPLIQRGITKDWFITDDNRAVYRFVLDHWQQYNEVPTPVTVKDNFPNYRILAVEDTIDYLLDQMVAYRRRQSTIRIIQDAGEAIALANNHEEAIKIISAGLESIISTGVSDTTDINLTDDPFSRFEEYRERKNRPGGLLGIPTGFPTIDAATAGLQPGQLVTLVASPKTGKSTLLMQVAINMHLQDKFPMFQSFEMSNQEQRDRHDALRAQVSHARLTRGTLNQAEERSYRQMLRDTEKATVPFLLTDSVTGMTVSAIAAKVNTVNPDILFIDGAYLMIDETTGEAGTPQSLTNITRSLKRLAQRANICVVVSTQSLLWKQKKNVVSADSIGYSSSWLQDSDVVLGLQRTEDDDPNARILKIVASRNCPTAQVDMIFDYETGKFEEDTP